MDADLERMSREQLNPSLWGLLPEKTDPVPVVPEWPQFIQGCVRYRQSLDEQAPDALRTKESYRRGEGHSRMGD